MSEFSDENDLPQLREMILEQLAKDDSIEFTREGTEAVFRSAETRAALELSRGKEGITEIETTTYTDSKGNQVYAKKIDIELAPDLEFSLEDLSIQTVNREKPDVFYVYIATTEHPLLPSVKVQIDSEKGGIVGEAVQLEGGPDLSIPPDTSDFYHLVRLSVLEVTDDNGNQVGWKQSLGKVDAYVRQDNKDEKSTASQAETAST